MKHIIAALVCFATFSNTHAQGEEALVQAVRARLGKVQDYEAQGRMRIDVPFIQAPPSDVTVYYKKPNLYKVKKADGISILPKGGAGLNMGSVLSGEAFTVVPAGTATVGGTAVKVVKLIPQAEGSDIVLMTLYIDEKAALIRRSNVATRESGSYDVELTYGKQAAWGLPDKAVFSFNAKGYKLPKGLALEYDKGGQPAPATPKDAKGKVEIVYSNYKINKGLDAAVFAK